MKRALALCLGGLLSLPLPSHAAQPVVVLAPSRPLPPAPKRLLDSVPDGVALAAVLGSSAWGLIRTYLDDKPELKADLSALCTKRLGVDLTRIEGAAAWRTSMSPGPRFGLLLRLPGAGPLVGQAVAHVEGVPLVQLDTFVAAAIPAGLLIGSRDEVERGVRVALGQAPSVSPTTPVGRLLGQVGELDFGAILEERPSQGDPVSSATPLSQFGFERATVTLTGGSKLTLDVEGPPAKLEQARGMIQVGVGALLSQVQRERERAMGDSTRSFFEDAAAVAAYHQTAALWRDAAPRLEGTHLISRLQAPATVGSTGTIAAIGVLAAVAVPAFQKYLRRAKESEPRVRLAALSTAVYNVAVEGGALAPAPWTPTTPCCAQPGGQCRSDPADWSQPAWALLGFRVDEPGRFQYRVAVNRTGAPPVGRSRKKAPPAPPGPVEVTLEARGDTECVGELTVFRRTLTVHPDGRIDRGELIEERAR